VEHINLHCIHMIRNLLEKMDLINLKKLKIQY